jgi:hypothetical protein
MFARYRTLRLAPRVAVVIVALGMLASRDAGATPTWVDRLLTLPGPVAGTVDVGGALAYGEQDVMATPACGYCGFFGTGLSVEGVLGIASRVDIGLRVGIRGFNDNLPGPINEGAVADADAYARPFDQVGFYGGWDNVVYGDGPVSNPELRVRVRILHIRHVFELGVEARAILPFADGTVFTQVVGVPMALHLGRYVRFDFGAYNHFTFLGQPNPVGNQSLLATIDLPAALWFQVHRRVFLGPMFGIRWYSQDVYSNGSRDFDVNLGFGLGVSLTRFLDLKTQIYFPRIEDGAQYWGAGVGLGFYFN